MKYINMKGLVWMALTLFAAPAIASLTTAGDDVTPETKPADNSESATPKEYFSMSPGSRNQGKIEDLPAELSLICRAYGDSVVLRWGVSTYPAWSYLNHTGYTIYRVSTSEESGFEVDTLAKGIKPLSLDAFRSRYPDQTDSIAYMAMGSIYGTGELTPEQTGYEPGTVFSLSEIAQDQKMRIAVALLTADWRPDVADALALRFVDRTARKGRTYDYIVAPTVPDTTGVLEITNGVCEAVVNKAYKPGKYDITITDSIVGHGQVMLSWNDSINGTFNIYRRPYTKKGTGAWEKVNDLPYLPPFNFDGSVDYVMYSTGVPEIGTYEYAVRAYDPFGDLTSMSEPHKVYFPDMEAPAPPVITSIVIDRPEADPSAKIFADIYFRKDSMEPDFVRYVPMYYNERDTLKQWRLLTGQYIAPTDTMVRVDVTNLSTGMVTIAAVDTAENMGYAMPRFMHIADMKPPKAPTNFRGMPSLDGSIALMWDMTDTLDLDYYEVLFANAPDHEFARASLDKVKSRSFTDTVAVDANERYIYYTVRAIDYGNNIGACSDTIRVLRPNPAPPSRAHLDSAFVSGTTTHQRWIGSNDEIIRDYRIYRRKQGTASWQLMRICDGDSVRAAGYVIQFEDSPEPDMHTRYEYAVETYSFWDITSGLSNVYSVLLRPELNVNTPIKLLGVYDRDKGETRLAWEVDKNVGNGAPYYFCIYRKGSGDKTFKYLTDAESHVRTYSDSRTNQGEAAEYYVSIRFEDGRQGSASNIIKIVAPAPPKPENVKR